MAVEFLCRPEVWVTFAFVLLFYALFRWRSGGRVEPPGPWGLPVFGYLPFLGRKMNLTISQLAKKYGDVFQFRLGSRKIVVISGQKTIRKALLDEGATFAGRPDFYSYKIADDPGFSDFTPAVRLHKKRTLKAFGHYTKVRRKELEQVAHNAVFMLIAKFREMKNQPFDPKPIMDRVACTIMGFICYGRFFDVNDDEVSTILGTADGFAYYVAFGVLCDFFPWTKFLFRKQLRGFEELMNRIKSYSNKLVSARLKSNDGEVLRNIFRTIANEEDESEEGEVDTEMIKRWSSLFGAGFGTITATLRYGIMILALHPEVQQKVKNEIDSVVGKDRYPDFDDESSLPYTVATITEIYRHHSLSALAVTHSTTCDTEFSGYFIAKNTPVIFNLYSANRDERVFSDPEKFNPERYFTETGSLNTALTECVVPYGLGYRRCSGEPVARLEIFMFFATILQQCIIEEAPGHPLDLGNYIMAFGIMHKPFQVIFRSRSGEW